MEESRASFAPSDAQQLTVAAENAEFLCAHGPALPPQLQRALDGRTLRAVNMTSIVSWLWSQAVLASQ